MNIEHNMARLVRKITTLFQIRILLKAPKMLLKGTYNRIKIKVFDIHRFIKKAHFYLNIPKLINWTRL